MMTDISKEAVAKMLDGVTPPPWNSSADAEGLPYGVEPRVYSAEGTLLAEVGNLTLDQDTWEANARFIAYAREAVPAMSAKLAEVEARNAHWADRAEAAEALVKAYQDGTVPDLTAVYLAGGLDRRDAVRELTAEVERLRAALNRFCDRVEAGEVRSKSTYAEFCTLLDRDLIGPGMLPVSALKGDKP